jgi:hypothetical protein
LTQHVFFEWPRPSRDFSLLNFKALESFLAALPQSIHRPLLLAPGYALHYKFSESLSAASFQKFAKRGYE